MINSGKDIFYYSVNRILFFDFGQNLKPVCDDKKSCQNL